eukprot:scaffold880_cov20-Prasinocladus_malaysianus.AAC.1
MSWPIRSGWRHRAPDKASFSANNLQGPLPPEYSTLSGLSGFYIRCSHRLTKSRNVFPQLEVLLLQQANRNPASSLQQSLGAELAVRACPITSLQLYSKSVTCIVPDNIVQANA